MREVAEFDTRKGIVTAAIAWAVAFAVSGLIWLLLSFAAVNLLVSASG